MRSTVGLSGLKGFTVFSDMRMSLIMLKVFWCSSSQVQATPFCCKGLMLLVRCARSEMNEPG